MSSSAPPGSGPERDAHDGEGTEPVLRSPDRQQPTDQAPEDDYRTLTADAPAVPAATGAVARPAPFAGDESRTQVGADGGRRDPDRPGVGPRVRPDDTPTQVSGSVVRPDVPESSPAASDAASRDASAGSRAPSDDDTSISGPHEPAPAYRPPLGRPATGVLRADAIPQPPATDAPAPYVPYDLGAEVRAELAAIEAAESSFKHPAQIGPFKVVKLLGEGGMGAVYLAEQSEPVRRQVAIKLVHASLRSPMAVARFAAERQAMARLSHPHVAQLYEAGTTGDGFPYFAMEYLPGESLTSYCDRRKLGVRERVEMFVKICQGVLHAHQKGLIHRDLKPGNLLIAEADGVAVPKVIDFGIAKAMDQPLVDQEELTGVGSAIGTPSYMSPEALAASADLDTRTDVYSLGIVLYELLAGVRPHDVTGRALMLMFAGGKRLEIKRPSARFASLPREQAQALAGERGLGVGQLAERLRGDLDWIAMKAIAEDREQRYGSAAELAQDLERYLRDEPIEARPPSLRYRVGKLVRRHRVAFAGAAVVLVALVLGIVGTSLGMMHAAREAEAARQVSAFLARIFEVSDPGEARGNSVTARELLDQGASRIRTELHDQPLVQARLMRTIGGVYQSLGLYAEAEPLERDALAVRRAALGERSAEVGISLDALGTVYNKLGRYAEAERVQREAVAVLEQQPGAETSSLAEALTQLGLTCFLLDKRTEAESLYRRALALRESALRPDDPAVASILAHLGFLLNNEGRPGEAVGVLSRALGIRERALGGNHYLVAQSLDLLADAYAAQARHAEAEVHYLRSLGIKREVLAPEHPNLAESQFALGRLYAAQGEHAKAEAMLKEGLVIAEKSLGPLHVNLSRGLQPLGTLQANLGRWLDAEATFERLVRVYEAAVGPEHKWVGQALNNLGWVQSDGLRDYEKAEPVLRRAVAIFPPEKNPGYDGALARWSLANCLRDAQRYAAAESTYIDAIRMLEPLKDAQGKPHAELPSLRADYAKSLRASGREAEAAALEAPAAS